jgi:ketosteroid isomerase-like protein
MLSPAAGRSVRTVLAWGLVLGCGRRTDRAPTLSARDSSAIAAVQAAYVSAWLADDTAGVLATLDRGAILLPPGRLPVAGHAAIRDYWWPTDGSRTTIRQFTWDLAELAGAPDLAYSRGTSIVSWRYEKDTTRSEQTSRNLSLTIFVRGRDGKWRILRQMWGPSLPG